MGILGFLSLSLSFAAFGIACGSKCVPETTKCLKHLIKIEPHTNLRETERELNAWCRKQSLYYDCVGDVLFGAQKGNLSVWPIDLLVSKMFSDDLCLKGSTSRKRYLNNAACMNRLDTEYCTLPEYLDIVTPGGGIPASRCSLSEKTFTCIAATLVMNCGFDAARVYRFLLKVTHFSEEVCLVDGSEGEPPCRVPDSNDTRSEKLSEIYYGLVHRIGSIPEQDEPTRHEVQDDPSVVSYETTDSTDSTRELLTDEVSEAIRLALYTLDQNGGGTEQPDIPDPKKRPIVTEPFKGLLFYNYSGTEFVFYWRQPDNYRIENGSCKHLQPSYMRGIIFRCEVYARFKDPDCIKHPEGGDEELTPELIKDIDPDIPDDSVAVYDPSPYWMTELDGYRKERELREQTSTTTDASVDPAVTVPTFLSTASSLLRATEAVAEQEVFKWWEYPSAFSDDLRNEIVSVLIPEPEKLVPTFQMYHFGDSATVFFFDDSVSKIENLTCSRVNECHERGRGVFKCKMMPRKIEVCDECGTAGTEAPVTTDDGESSASTSQDSSGTEFISSSESSFQADSSSSCGGIVPSDNVRRLFAGDEKPTEANDLRTVYYQEDVTAENLSELPQMDFVAAHDSDEQEVETSTDIRLVVLEQNPSAGVVYAVEGMELFDNESLELATSSEEGGYGLLNENIFVLQNKESTNEEAAYAVIEEDQSSRD